MLGEEEMRNTSSLGWNTLSSLHGEAPGGAAPRFPDTLLSREVPGFG